MNHINHSVRAMKTYLKYVEIITRDINTFELLFQILDLVGLNNTEDIETVSIIIEKSDLLFKSNVFDLIQLFEAINSLYAKSSDPLYQFIDICSSYKIEYNKDLHDINSNKLNGIFITHNNPEIKLCEDYIFRVKNENIKEFISIILGIIGDELYNIIKYPFAHNRNDFFNIIVLNHCEYFYDMLKIVQSNPDMTPENMISLLFIPLYTEYLEPVD